MVFGVIKDYGSKLWDSIKSGGTSLGGFLKEYHQPILGAIEGATGILKHIPHPIMSPISGVINAGLKSLKNKVDDVPNDNVKKQLIELQNGISKEPPTPEKHPDPKTIINPTFDIITKTPSITVKPNIGAFQHNVLQGKAVPYDLMRFSKKHMKPNTD